MHAVPATKPNDIVETIIARQNPAPDLVLLVVLLAQHLLLQARQLLPLGSTVCVRRRQSRLHFGQPAEKGQIQIAPA